MKMYGMELLLVIIGATLGAMLAGCLFALFPGANLLIDDRTWRLLDCSRTRHESLLQI